MSTGDEVTLAHFRDALSSRLYLAPLRNSLVLGLWTAVLSVTIGLPLAWRRDALGPEWVVGDRFTNLLQLFAHLDPSLHFDRREVLTEVDALGHPPERGR